MAEPITTPPPSKRPGLWPALRRFLIIGLTSLGAGRQAYLYEAFVRGGWIPESVFLSDYAKTTVLPGASFVNLTFMSGLRIGGLPVAIGGTILVFLPGTILIVIAALALSTGDARVANLLHGILVGAVAVLTTMVIRISKGSVTDNPARVLALGAFALMVANVPLVLTVIVIGALGLWWHRPRRMSS
jgi:chromate transport protein ChrA